MSEALNNNQIDTTVIIVNWNSDIYLQRTIESIYEWTKDVSFEVTILDNDSKKDNESYKYIQSIKGKFENLKIIENKDNLGFAKANNIGMKESCSKNVILVNPDVIFKSNVIKELSDYLNNHKDVGMIGPKVLNPDNTFQTSCMRGVPYPIDVFYSLSGISLKHKDNPKYNKFSLFHLNREEINEVAGLSGCCMMVKRTLINQIGMMDEQFFLYQEETDWCWRAYNNNWKIIYNPNAVIIHEKGATTKKKLIKNNFVFCESMIKFFKKHHFKRYNIFQKIFFLTLIRLNLLLRLFHCYTSKEEKSYKEV